MNSGRRDLLRLSPLALAGLVPHTGAARADGSTSAAHGPALFDVRAYGATGGGKVLDSPGVNAAIEAAAAAGGGTVYFPAGTYLCFSIHLRSFVDLYLAQGCTLLAADSPLAGEATGQLGGTYDAAESNAPWESYQDYGHNHFHNSLLWGEDIHNLSITGPGLIFGRGLSRGYGGTDGYKTFTAEQPGVGNKAIALKRCRNVTFRDFSILKAGHFGLLLLGVDNLTIDNLTIDTDRDGIDIDCCRNVHVTNCTVNSPWDDGICPKSSYALGYARATENVTIANCIVSGSYKLGSVLDGTFKHFAPEEQLPRTGRIKCGTESNGGFRNITITNCVFDGCSGFAIESVDGALCEDLTISNITMRHVTASPLFFRLGARLRGPKPLTKVGTMKRILISNVTCFDASTPLASILAGIPGYPVEDVKISNFYAEHRGGGTSEMAIRELPENIDHYPEPNMFGPTPAQGFFLRHVKNLEMSHVEIAPMTPDARPSFHLHDVSRADFLAITAPPAPAFALHEVTDFRLHLSRASADLVLATAVHQMV